MIKNRWVYRSSIIANIIRDGSYLKYTVNLTYFNDELIVFD